MPKPNIAIHFGASHDDISVDGVTFRRRDLTRHQFTFLRNVVIDTLVNVGAIRRRGR